MSQILIAATRALRSLFEPGMFWHLLWPSLLSFLLWIVLGVMFIGDLADMGVAALPTLPWVGSWFVAGGSYAHLAASGLLQLLLWFLLIPFIYITALLLLGAFALPLMLERVAARDYADLERRCGGSQWGSLRTSLLAVAAFFVLLILSLPLWLIPGAGLVITILLSARLNRACFSYDALMNHADADEMRLLPQRCSTELNLLGIAAGVLAFVPFLNFLVPAWSGLSFVHYLLEALRRERARPFKDIPQE